MAKRLGMDDVRKKWGWTLIVFFSLVNGDKNEIAQSVTLTINGLPCAIIFLPFVIRNVSLTTPFEVFPSGYMSQGGECRSALPRRGTLKWVIL